MHDSEEKNKTKITLRGLDSWREEDQARRREASGGRERLQTQVPHADRKGANHTHFGLITGGTTLLVWSLARLGSVYSGQRLDAPSGCHANETLTLSSRRWRPLRRGIERKLETRVSAYARAWLKIACGSTFYERARCGTGKLARSAVTPRGEPVSWLRCAYKVVFMRTRAYLQEDPRATQPGERESRAGSRNIRNPGAEPKRASKALGRVLQPSCDASWTSKSVEVKTLGQRAEPEREPVAGQQGRWAEERKVGARSLAPRTRLEAAGIESCPSPLTLSAVGAGKSGRVAGDRAVHHGGLAAVWERRAAYNQASPDPASSEVAAFTSYETGFLRSSVQPAGASLHQQPDMATDSPASPRTRGTLVARERGERASQKAGVRSMAETSEGQRPIDVCLASPRSGELWLSQAGRSRAAFSAGNSEAEAVDRGLSSAHASRTRTVTGAQAADPAPVHHELGYARAGLSSGYTVGETCAPRGRLRDGEADVTRRSCRDRMLEFPGGRRGVQAARAVRRRKREVVLPEDRQRKSKLVGMNIVGGMTRKGGSMDKGGGKLRDAEPGRTKRRQRTRAQARLPGTSHCMFHPILCPSWTGVCINSQATQISPLDPELPPKNIV
ncbi:hypothetical protein V8D89_007382 [Ganoderma adspersum]